MLAVGTELSQVGITSRTPLLTDVSIDLAGGSLSLLLIIFFTHFFKPPREPEF